jgi:RNA polymerase sigma factor (sigma-70 family)
MPRGPLNTLVRYIGKLAGTPVGPELTDAELLRRFVGEHDETAFAVLVERHGRLVRAVCRRLLAHEQDAEDAFQATLLVLARKAGSIHNRRSLASWLYGVAYRTALKTRTTIARRQKYEQRAEMRPPRGPVSEAALRELQAILEQEVQRLPEKFRAPFLLCCLEGKSKGEAAEELGWPEGTVSGRIAEARKMLQRRLTRRGITLAAALCALAVTEAATATPPPALVTAAVRAALAFAAGKGVTGVVSARVVAIAEAVLRTEAATRLKVVLALLVVLALTGVGAGAWLHSATADHRPADPQKDQATVANPPPQAGPDEKTAGATMAAAPGGDAAGNLTFTGQVLDANGLPRAGAAVSLAAFPNVPVGQRQGDVPRRVLVEGRADAQGRFTLSLPKETATAHFGFALLAAGDGDGLNWDLLPSDAARQNVELRLQPAHTVRGRLVDDHGQPAAGVEVQVAGLTRGGPNPQHFQIPAHGEPRAGLPSPLRTDAAGGFEFGGVGPGCEVQLLVEDDRFAPQWLVLTTQAGERTDAGTLPLAPRRVLEGSLVCQDTGLPLAGVRVTGSSVSKKTGALSTHVDAWTDAEGRFRLCPFPGEEVGLLAYPPAGSPYLILQHRIPWRDDDSRTVSLTLPRGVLLQGRVTEAGDKPVAGATVRFNPRTIDHPILSRRRSSETGIAWYLADTVSGADGSFHLAALPGPGHLLVKGQDPGFLHVETTTGAMQSGQPGGTPLYPDALVPLDLAPDSGLQDFAIVLRRGVTMKGHVVGPDDQPAALAVVLCPTYVPGEDFYSQGRAVYAQNGQFELPGLDPERAVPVLFCDPQRQQGARVELTGQDEPTVRLVPCRTATVRFVDPDGKPATGLPVELAVVVQPGGQAVDPQSNRLRAGFAVPASRLVGARFAAAGPGPGEVTFRGLIPGATYLIQVDEGRGMVVKKEFTIKPDEDLCLPDIVIQRRADPPRPK